MRTATPNNPSLLSLRIFLAVYEQRSVGAAASSLGMSQSGLSSALAKMRRQFGDALFVNTASGMQPTTRANELAGPMRDAVQCIEQRILGKASFDPAGDEREFRIALSDTAEAMYLPRVLAAVGPAAPRVRLRTVAMPQPQVQRALSEGKVDIALGYFPDLRSAEFMRRKIGQHAFACICSCANRHVIQDFSVRRYSESRHAVVEAPTRTHGLLETYLQKKGIGRHVALTTPHFMSLPDIIAGTDLLATVPDAIAESFAQNRRLVRLELPFRSPVFEAHLHWSKSVSNDPAHRWFRGVVFDALAAAGRRPADAA